jgi:hypothetical protein
MAGVSRLAFTLILATALYGCEPPSVALKLEQTVGNHDDAIRCTVNVRKVVDARAEPQGLGNTMYTRIEDADVTGWVTEGLNRAGFVTDADATRESENFIDVLVKAVYVQPVSSSRVATVVLGVEAPGADLMKHFRGTDTSVHTGASQGAIERILNAALDDAVLRMRHEYDIGCT